MLFDDYNIVKDEGNLQDKYDDRKIIPHHEKAVREMKSILGSEKYNYFKTLAIDSDLSAEQKEELKTAQLAEANLTLAYAIIRLNIKTSGEGIIRSIGKDNNKTDLLGSHEIQALKNEFKETAMMLLKPFIPDNKSDNDKELMFLSTPNLKVGII